MSEHLHVLMVADEEDAMDYAWDPKYTRIKKIGTPLEGVRAHEVSFTPRATMQPHWMEDLLTMKHSVLITDFDKPEGVADELDLENRIHYISLYETKEES